MDITTIIGLVFVSVAIIGSILTGADLILFVDIPSVICVGGGLIGATCIKWPIEVIKTVATVMMKTIFITPVDPKKTIDEIVKLAETARRESVFALEKVQIDDIFLKKAMNLAADNRPPEVLQSILQLEIDSMEERHKVGVMVLDGMGADGPAFGMLGTLIGLVIMLQNLSDPSSIGPAMAVALLTTFYGSVVANAIALPMKVKIEYRSKSEVMKMNIIIAGTLGIVAGENPRLIREKLNSFLPPKQRALEETKE
ncbi:MAG: flagellar motor protein MotP [Bdellovibrionales bacterium RIFOXYB1_FULL_37_110]|nr:MAG: flagellar motor protein MotP [Bdellovibrionales bacterium RIFOXYA1_FULL_38_20]OFZ52506.1 MAG: flagellar motor protein MotP [Bdellovibrionales bacterium RIFOXYC1_FULL_37_79]OFZ59708.1 MAG: flagellar motor protein MotP [Bdellovibrionales bacterium RIFOXYB1_FULL_37_110]OFZ62635.1 MAG: flagellar motor protein MotP [Bdellovibrionales bacterium RIFOXYD1_FULL_36_51]OFZ66681.1 MAG: flagellar motor protein MotP [Bdellovibrionales bacterium RIFOXYB2_FULL_36_6]